MIELPRSLIVLAGLPFTGKTTIGRELEHLTNATFLDIDVARQEIAPGNGWHGPDQEKAIMRAAYEHNHQKAAQLLQIGKSVILAATYSRPDYHKLLRELAEQQSVPLKFFLLHIPDALVQVRLSDRQKTGSPSNITSLESYREVANRYQPFPDRNADIDTSAPLESVLADIEAVVSLQGR